jgi:hypothetical protein
MGMIAFLLKNKNLVLVGILAAAILGAGIYIKILKSDLSAAIAEKNVVVAELQVSQASVKGLQQAILDQNAAIDKMKAEIDARLAAHQIEINKARAIAISYKKQAQELMDSKVPPTESNCEASNNLINKELQNAE